MSLVFYPKIVRLVDASSPPHPQNTQYRVAIGEENWGGYFVTGLKIQMMYDGKISGRRSPTYPIGYDDEARVRKAIDEVWDEYRRLNGAKGQETSN